jgi:hypothetical protein
MQQFDINKMTPYNRQFGLKQMKSAAANQEYSQDVSNTYNASGNMASIGMMAGKTPSSLPGQPQNKITGVQAFQPYQKNLGGGDYTNMTLPDTLPSWAQGH